MGQMTWGLLGRESVGSERRARTLGLGAAVRNFNEIAVPGLGGVWFARQIFLATLGVAVNELAQNKGGCASNIEVANALEAMGCWHAFRKADRQDQRLRGREKLPRDDSDLSFAKFSRRSFYVTQPMRMQTVQALRALGLVTASGERFNGYAMTPNGQDFLEVAFRDLPRPSKMAHLAALSDWVCGGALNMNTDAVWQLLSPAEALPEHAREMLRDLLTRGSGEDAMRRRSLLAWFDDPGHRKVTAGKRPKQLSEQHWHDLQAGRLFFHLQSGAFEVLDVVEAIVAQKCPKAIAANGLNQAPVRSALDRLRESAKIYLQHGYSDVMQTGVDEFAKECMDESDGRLIESLVARDGRVLRLQGGSIVPGEAFSDTAQIAEGDEDEDQPQAVGDLPSGLSHRVSNFYWLNLDLNGKLAAELARQSEERNG